MGTSAVLAVLVHSREQMKYLMAQLLAKENITTLVSDVVISNHIYEIKYECGVTLKKFKAGYEIEYAKNKNDKNKISSITSQKAHRPTLAVRMTVLVQVEVIIYYLSIKPVGPK